MFNVCPRCGEYSVEKAVGPGPVAICPFCGHAHPFLQLPLFVVTGASGAGKTAVTLGLVPALRGEAVVLECDILWRPEFDRPEHEYREFRDVWLRVAKNVGQAGLPVVLVGSGVPSQYEDRPERRYFSSLHYLALVADEEDLAQRLRQRPAWRESGSDEFVARMLEFNRWLQDNAALTAPPMTLLSTSGLTVEETVRAVASWVRHGLENAACE